MHCKHKKRNDTWSCQWFTYHLGLVMLMVKRSGFCWVFVLKKYNDKTNKIYFDFFSFFWFCRTLTCNKEYDDTMNTNIHFNEAKFVQLKLKFSLSNKYILVFKPRNMYTYSFSRFRRKNVYALFTYLYLFSMDTFFPGEDIDKLLTKRSD